jgi:putative nucleotidyltransferase with HDIG domain
MNREEAWAIVREYVKGDGLRKHMLAVEAAMRAYARRYGEDKESWAVIGLLHDFDWEIHHTLEQHPMGGAPILRERGVSEEDIRTVLSHGERTGVPRTTLRDKALYAVDDLTGLITAVALVRPSKDIRDVKIKSVKKKWKDKSFAAAVDRKQIERAAEDLGVELWEHVSVVLEAMKGIAAELGLDGSAVG